MLLEDVPGTAKTVLARAIAGSIAGAAFSRIQCTPDLQPTDVTGLSIFNQRTRDFEFRPGPVFANVLLVDEINRAMPKTQSALLEAMAEQQVTVDGDTRRLAEPFLVLATENPIEQEGTFPLPEAQLDRFFLRTALGYPAEDDEVRSSRSSATSIRSRSAEAGLDARRAARVRAAVERVYVDPLVRRWIVELVRATRERDGVASARRCAGASRSSVRRAPGRSSTAASTSTPVDVEELFLPVVMHRIVFEPSSWPRSSGRSAGTAAADAFRASA